MNYIIFYKKDELVKSKIQGILQHSKGKWVENAFYGEYPINALFLIPISDNEFNIRLNHEKSILKPFQEIKVNDEIHFDGCQSISKDGDYIFETLSNTTKEFAIYTMFYSKEKEEEILSFLKKEWLKRKEEKMEKYTKFNEIPQFTRNGNWECDFDLVQLVNFIENEINEMGLDMNPDFQRGHVWTEQQQIAFIEFFLKGGKTGRVIYLNKPDWNLSVPKDDYNDYVCVDGLQRYTAIKRFINNEIKVFGSYFKEYEDSLRINKTMRVNVNDLKSKKEVLQWYIEFNAGGTPHSKEEIDRVKTILNSL